MPLGRAKTPTKTCYIWYFPVTGIRISENHGNPRNSVEIMKIKESLLSVPLGHVETPLKTCSILYFPVVGIRFGEILEISDIHENIAFRASRACRNPY